MKGKILESQHNPGYDSYILKHTKYGTFSSQVFLQEEDKDIENSFDGCRIAEYNADLQAYKMKAKMMRQRAIGAQTVYNNIAQSCTPEDLESDFMQKLARQVDYLRREADKAKDYYERMTDYRPFFIDHLLDNRRKANALYKKYSEKNNS